jgi:hypothetical protein
MCPGRTLEVEATDHEIPQPNQLGHQLAALLSGPGGYPAVSSLIERHYERGGGGGNLLTDVVLKPTRFGCGSRSGPGSFFGRNRGED